MKLGYSIKLLLNHVYVQMGLSKCVGYSLHYVLVASILIWKRNLMELVAYVNFSI